VLDNEAHPVGWALPGDSGKDYSPRLGIVELEKAR